MVEIFTVGGGEYIVNVLNAVAAWTGAGGYKGLIQVALVMGMVLGVIVVAFNQDWRAWLNWFLGATLIYMCLMVPRMDVHVTDRVNPSLAPATVANVPLGLALMASFTSQAGDYLTEAESYTREARRAEEMASRLENQASWYEANSAAGTLNLSQTYREWGMAEIEANRDYYGPVRFDDIEFQMSARGQQLQSRFVESYADRLQDDIEADLSLPDFAPVSRPGIGSAGQVRARGAVSSAGGPSMPDAPDRSGISDEVERVRRQGRGRIGTVRGYLDGQTEGATGASEEAADAIKEWRRP